MFNSLSLFILIPIFLIGAGAVWVAGIQLSKTTDTLSHRLHLGEALSGLIILAVVTNLPEIAITVSAALTRNLAIAIGNLLGGIGVQTLVIVLLDVATGKKSALMRGAASLVLVLEAMLVIAVLVVAIMGTQFPSSFTFARIEPASLLIVIVWLVGLWLLNRARKDLPWQNKGQAPDTMQPSSENSQQGKQPGMARTISIFAISAIVTLIAGFVLEESGSAIADDIGLSGVLFGATFLAAATSLPEIATGIESVKLKDYQMAVSDIFGGNAFLPTLFLVAGLISGQAVLPQAQHSDIYLACLGMLLTAIYIVGIIFRPREYLRMGLDSWAVLIVYVIGTAGLVLISLSQK